MSTSFYYVKEPFTSIRLEPGPVHDLVTLWEGHAKSGTLVVRSGLGQQVCSIFAQRESDDRAPMRTHWGGKDRGCVVTENVRGLDPNLVLISEYGEPITVEKIRARAGHVRADGMPGELFGYDDRL